MPTSLDRASGWRSRLIRFRGLLLVAAALALWQVSSSWFSTRFAVPRPLAEAGVMLVLVVALIPGEALFRSVVPAVTRRPADPAAGRHADIGRVVVILYALVILVGRITALCRAQPGLDAGTVLSLTLAVAMCLGINGPGRTPLFRRLVDNATVQPDTVRALLHGFAALAVLSLAALVYDGIRPGALPDGIGIALAVGILVVQVGFWHADRRAGLEQR